MEMTIVDNGRCHRQEAVDVIDETSRIAP